MKLKKFYPDFIGFNSIEQEQFISEYRLKRAKDFENRKKPSAAPQFSSEEKALMKKLGLSVKTAKILGGL